MPTTSTEKRAGRRNRVIKTIRKMKPGKEFTSQDIAVKCNLSNSWSAGQIIKSIVDEFDLQPTGRGHYRVGGE
jgi:hypothetical protein